MRAFRRAERLTFTALSMGRCARLSGCAMPIMRRSDAETRVRTITRCEVSERNDERAGARIIEMTMSAEGFLRYMVRSIAGTLMAVGRGEMDNEKVRQAIERGDRSLVAATAPPCGLTLVSVEYSK